MKRTIIILVLFLVIQFSIPNKVFADSTCSIKPGETSTSCDTGLGELLSITVFAYDEYGYKIGGVNVTFDWLITQPTPSSKLGYFENVGAVAVSPSTTKNRWVDTNKNGESTLKMRANSSTVTDGIIMLNVIYGGITITHPFNIHLLCLRTPFLYYGIASVKDSSDDNWQKSTAEILDTCLPGYKLYDGVGQGRE